MTECTVFLKNIELICNKYNLDSKDYVIDGNFDLSMFLKDIPVLDQKNIIENVVIN